MTPLLALYSLLAWCLTPFAPILVSRRRRLGKEDPVRYTERFGKTSHARPPGRLVWIHCASIGESKSVQPLIQKMLAQQADLSVLLTSGTVTSAALMAKSLDGTRSFHQFPPLDLPLFNTRFLDHWKPDMALFVESEIWPNMLTQLGNRSIPVFLLNGRISEKSHRIWQRVLTTARTTFSRYTAILAQSDRDATRLSSLSGKPAEMHGNLKYDLDQPSMDSKEAERLRPFVENRTTWLAVSTHPGEETLCVDIHKRLAQSFPDLLTIVLPRHPERGSEIAADLRASGHSVAQRSCNQDPTTDTQFWLADTLGETGLFFSLSPVTLMGGTLTPVGGHNFLEPALLESAIVSGPFVDNFLDLSHGLEQAQGLVIANDQEAYATAIDRLLCNEQARRTQTQNAITFAQTGRGATDRTLQSLASHAPTILPDCLSPADKAKIAKGAPTP